MSLPNSGGNITPLLTVAQMIGFAILQKYGHQCVQNVILNFMAMMRNCKMYIRALKGEYLADHNSS